MKLLRLFLVASSVMLAAYNTSGQKVNMPAITGEFKDMRIEQFLIQLEKQSGYRFYYDTAMLDTIKINLSVKEQPLKNVLSLAFVKSNMLYAIDDDKNVFITKNEVVKTELPVDFFSPQKNINPSQQTDTFTAVNKSENKKEQNATLENKLYEIGDKNTSSGQGKVTIAGYVRDAKTGEPVVGASIYIEKLKTGILSDQYGYYSISLPKGRYILNIQSVGMKDTRRQVIVYSDGKMNLELQPEVMALKKVTVTAEKVNNIKSTQMGVQRISINAIKQVPVAFGEADVLKVVLTLPGVKSVGEASTGLNVRGGSADQNLILYNDATIYNPSHFFGMFSAFNPEIIKDVQLYKASIPARFGGRLSSVLDISSKEGNKKKMQGSAGIGVLTSRFNIEGPLIKDKTSFIVGARSTYANWLLKLLPDQYKNSKAGFYDVNLDITSELDKKNTLYITGYLSKDRFNLNNDTTYQYGNQNISVKWKHSFNNKIYSLVTAGNDRYDYSISSDKNPVNAYKLSFDINQTYFKTHFNYYVSTKHSVEFGVNSIYYTLHPGSYQPVDEKSLVIADKVQREQALESALYISDKYTVNSKLSLEAGVRYSLFNYLGPQTVRNYAAGVPKTTDNLIDTTAYEKGAFIKTYKGPELRLSLRYAFTNDFSVKAGYNSQRQYIHMISNTAAMAPTDIWKLSDPNIKPQYGEQYSLGLYKNFKSNTIETSVEVYYKNIKNYLDYVSGAVLVMNHHIETDVINTKGKAYGAEFLIRKTAGKLNGWLGYTYSRILLKQDDPTVGEVINNGEYYPANYDKPHDVTLVSNYKITHRFSLSLNTTYSTGRPITLPIGLFYYGNSVRTLYADRNAFRIPDYFRMDFSMNIEGNHKVHQKTHNSWTIGIYNLTGRKNPYSVYYVSENGVVTGYKLSIFGSAIPYINFNIRF
jgi:hypothetical protein